MRDITGKFVQAFIHATLKGKRDSGALIGLLQRKIKPGILFRLIAYAFQRSSHSLAILFQRIKIGAGDKKQQRLVPEKLILLV